MAKAHEGGRGRGAPMFNPKAKLDTSQMQVRHDDNPWIAFPKVTMVAKKKAKPRKKK